MPTKAELQAELDALKEAGPSNAEALKTALAAIAKLGGRQGAIAAEALK